MQPHTLHPRPKTTARQSMPWSTDLAKIESLTSAISAIAHHPSGRLTASQRHKLEDAATGVQVLMAEVRALRSAPLPTSPVGSAQYVYVASSWRNLDHPGLVQHIRELGIEAYDFRHPAPGDDGFAWDEIDPEWMSWTPEQFIAALEHPRAVEGFSKDFAAMMRADTFVLILPCGRSAHLELGWAVGAGKRTAIYLNGSHEPELMARMVNLITDDEDQLTRWLCDPMTAALNPGRASS